MKKYLLKILLFTVLALTFAACESDDIDEWKEPVINTKGIYILNNGNWGGNDASLSYYDTQTKTLSEKVFSNINKKDLGDLAQDMVIYGSKMYITVTSSNKIYITNLKGQLLKKNGAEVILSPLDGNQPMEPRSAISHNGKVYVTTQKGYVLRIDTTSFNIDKVKVGLYPEQMVVSEGKLFVANSGQQYDNKISIINLNRFNVEKTIELPAYNPANMAKDSKGNVYILCLSIYEGAKSSLYKMDPKTYAVNKLGDDVATAMAMNKDKLILMRQNYSDNTTSFTYYDTNKNELVNKSFITDGTSIKAGNCISVNTLDEEIYIGEAIYPNKGTMYVYSAEGKRINTFSSGGFYPIGTYFLPK